MEDQAIIELFFNRNERAIRELDNKYGKVCYGVAYNILNNKYDSEECVNDAYLGAWNTIPPQRPNPLLAFICKIVRNLSITYYRSNTAKKRTAPFCVALNEISDSIAAPEAVEDVVETKLLARTIECWLDTLSKENRILFMRRYWFADSYADIADRLGLSEKNVSVRLSRIRSDLRQFLLKEGMLG